MRSPTILCLVCALASPCVAQEAACDAIATAEGDDDRCLLLQSGVGVLQGDKEGDTNHHHAHKGHHAHKIEHKVVTSTDATADGPWDILKHVGQAVGGILGGASKLEKDFEAIKTKVHTFVKDVQGHMKDLLKNVKTAKSIEGVLSQVEETDLQIYHSAKHLHAAFAKAATTFENGVGKVAPAQFKTAMSKVLDETTKEARHFAESFQHAAHELKRVNRSLVCSKVSHGLHRMHKKATLLSGSASGLSMKNMNKEIKLAHDALPAAIKKEVDKVLNKASEAVETVEGSLHPVVQEIAHGMVLAFKGHCHELRNGAGQLQVGLLSTFVLGIVSFSM